ALINLRARLIQPKSEQNSRIPRINLEFLEIASVALLPCNDGDVMRLLRFARNDENSRIP
ncbi:hypothetical protein, partial [Campylobacter sp.]|uniref:hypothetical protein n=1 Tax=Campylobacter sp. TaxID=205 RepID=UPI002A5C3551